MDDTQSLRAAYALAPDRFCVAIHEMQPDDPFSIVLHFDGKLEQPWGRIDVRRNIVDLAAPSDPNARNCLGISDEGDFYAFDDTGAAPSPTKITGAGVYSEDADGSGPITGLTFLGGRLHAFGTSGQFYQQSDDGRWRRLRIEVEPISQRGTIAAMEQADTGSMLMAGTIVPGFWEKPDHLEQAQLDAAKAGDLERFQELAREADDMRASAVGETVDTGFLAFDDGTGWRRIETDTSSVLLAATFDDASFWTVGYAGTVLRGDMSGAFENLTVDQDRFLNFTDITSWNRKIVVTSDFGLHEWEEAGARPFDPALPIPSGDPARPLKVQTVGGTLFVFDQKQGVFRLFDGAWDHIAIPAELLEREFRGLGSRSP